LAEVIPLLPFNTIVDPYLFHANPPAVQCTMSGPAATMQNDVWYKYAHSGATQVARITVTPPPASQYDAVLEIWSGTSCNNMIMVVCGNQGAMIPGNAEAENVLLVDGQTYWIRFGANGGDWGALPGPRPTTLDIQTHAMVANDLPCGATNLNATGLPFSDPAVDNSWATDDVWMNEPHYPPEYPANWCGTDYPSATYFGLWYTYTPAANCTMNINDGGSQDVVLGAFAGTCDNLTLTACAGRPYGIEDLSVPLTAGTHYWFLVGVLGPDTFPPGGPSIPTTPLVLTFTGPSCGAICATCPGDMSGDWTFNGNDIQQFVDCFIAAAGGPPTPTCGCADVLVDGVVNSLDIDAFVGRLLAPPPCP
jgi:hypothetical protein